MMPDERKKQFLFSLQTALPGISAESWKRPQDWLPYPPIDPMMPREIYGSEYHTDEMIHDNAIMVLSRGRGDISIDITCYGDDGRALVKKPDKSMYYAEVGKSRTDSVTFDDDDMRWSIWYTLGGKNIICDLYSESSPEILEIIVGKDIGRVCDYDPIIIDSSINTPLHLAIPMYCEDISRICQTRGCECIELYGQRENYSYKTYTKIDYKEED